MHGIAPGADRDVVDCGVFEVVGEGFGRDIREEVGIDQRRRRRDGGRSAGDGRVGSTWDDVERVRGRWRDDNGRCAKGGEGVPEESA